MGFDLTHPGARPHGGWLDPELRAIEPRAERRIDFSVNVNPYGPCNSVTEAIRNAPIDRYPDPEARLAKAALAQLARTSECELTLGHGAVELLWTLALLLSRSKRPCMIVEPTFGEFRAALDAQKATSFEWRARREDGFAIDLEAIGAALRRRDAGALYLCAPNTPTGVCPSAAAVARFAERHRDVTIVLDQSFLSLSERHADVEQRFTDNVVCVRSLTKDHAIPGVRVGYLIASSDLVSQVEAARPAWSVSALAQAAVLGACADPGFVADSRVKCLADRARLATSLTALRLSCLPSTTAFLLVDVGDARALQKRLWQHHGMLVRDCTSFGLPSYVRLSARPAPDDALLVQALAQELR